jgi:hypothetical protein
LCLWPPFGSGVFQSAVLRHLARDEVSRLCYGLLRWQLSSRLDAQMVQQLSFRRPWGAGSTVNPTCPLNLTWLKLSNVLVQGIELFGRLLGGKLYLLGKVSL